MISTRLTPINAPSWDHSYEDPPSIRHDCFTVERLFVVPWGSGEGEVGYSPAKPGVRQPISTAVGLNGQVDIYAAAKNLVLRYDASGKLLQRTSVESGKSGFDLFLKYAPLPRPQDGAAVEALQKNDVFKYMFIMGDYPNGHLEVTDTQGKLVCRQWLPPYSEEASRYRWGVGDPNNVGGETLSDGSYVYVVFEEAGLVFYRYRLK